MAPADAFVVRSLNVPFATVWHPCTAIPASNVAGGTASATSPLYTSAAITSVSTLATAVWFAGSTVAVNEKQLV